jgi:hypothetical protein
MPESSMTIRGYDASGNVIWEEQVDRIVPSTYEGQYDVHLENGKIATENEGCLDRHYPGWREHLVDPEDTAA